MSYLFPPTLTHQIANEIEFNYHLHRNFLHKVHLSNFSNQGITIFACYLNERSAPVRGVSDDRKKRNNKNVARYMPDRAHISHLR